MLLRPMLLPLLFAVPALADQTVHLTPQPTGAQTRLGGSMYVPLPLSDQRPASITKLPAGLSDHPLFGVIKLPAATATPFAVVVDVPVDGKPSRLWVDANGDGDLTDDAPADWVAGADLGADAVPGLPNKAVAGKGGATLHLGTADHPRDLYLGMWRYDVAGLAARPPEQAAKLGRTLYYYRDYCTVGKVDVDGTPCDATLVDEMATGSFALAPGKLVRLFVDLNGNGKADAGEGFELGKPFKIHGRAYEATDVAADGTSLRIVATDKVAHSPDDVKVGQVAPAFAAADLAGAAVAFPGDYRGKVVLVDFWATWCGPCMAEVPTVVATYDADHARGFEILGVSMDQPDDGEKVKRVAGQHHMAWRQLVGASGKSRDVAELYSVNAIPSAFLVDGDTGRILAAGNDLRGPGLAKAVAAALAGRPSPSAK